MKQVVEKPLKETIKARAINLGFSLCGVTNLEPTEQFPRYEEWLQHGFHGEMAYLASERHVEPRKDPQRIAPWAKSILVLGWPYALNRSDSSEPAGQIAGYASGEDYHTALPRLITALIEEVKKELGVNFDFQIFTDSAPILERELASRAGLGWIGKNSCLISPKSGSAFLLAEVFLDCELKVDTPFIADHCGTCQRCIQACPTQCIQPNRSIDAARCISTLTIENKGTIPDEFIPLIGNHLFGCDLCQSVCPWNHFALPAAEAASLSPAQMIDMLPMDEAEFKSYADGRAISRAKRRGWIRDLCAVLANLKAVAAIPTLQKLLQEEADPIIRDSAATALKRLTLDH